RRPLVVGAVWGRGVRGLGRDAGVRPPAVLTPKTQANCLYPGGVSDAGGLWHVPVAQRLDLRLDDARVAARTDAVAELGVGVGREVVLELHPVVLIVADALAVTAHRQQPLQLLDVRQRLLQVADA